MKYEEYKSPNGITIEYIFSRSKQVSDELVIAFPGPAGMRGGEWGYFFSIKQIADVNTLFIRTNPDYTKSRLTYCQGEPLIENAVVELVNEKIKEANIKDVIAVGSSMGGWCSLYYGLKYSWNIIAGAPPYDFEDRSGNCLTYAGGNKPGKDKKWLNDLLPSAVRIAGEHGYKRKLFLMWGEGEHLWKAPNKGKQLLKDMDDAGIKYMYSLYPFSDHQTISELFPQVLKPWLNYYLGKTEKPHDVDELTMSHKVRFIKKMDDISDKICSLIKEIEGLHVNADVNNCKIEGSNDKWLALKNYVYIKEGWYWGFGNDYTEPVRIENGKTVFDIPARKGDKSILTFYFHSTLLRLFLRNNDRNILIWLLDNAMQYFALYSKKRETLRWMLPEEHLQRMLYFMQLHKLATANKIPHDCLQYIPEEIKHSILYAVYRRNRFFTPTLQLRLVLGLLHSAVYFRNEKIYADLCRLTFELLNEVITYHFDENGVCITGQMYYQDIIANELRQIMEFIQENQIDAGKLNKSVEYKYKKILEFTSHTDLPNGRQPAIGHTSYRLRQSRRWLKHSLGNFIKKKSNIAILEDDISHLTVNGGSNIHANWRHCDLLSFTWSYAGERIFCDAGGTGGIMAPYVASAIAHNAFICDDADYVTPDYEDWTSIEEVEEKDVYVMISMSHSLIDGVVMRRKLIWIKPNIVILLDNAESENEHSYSQNLLMDKVHISQKDKSGFSLQVDNEVEVVIKQCVQNTSYDVNLYDGTSDENDEDHYRGTLLDDWKTPHKGVNVVFTLQGRKADFVTAIECHSKKKEIAEKEKTLKKLYNHPERGLVVEFGSVNNDKDVQ